MRAAAERDGPLLIEATCNQVNQEGGYTGMTPTDFRQFVESVAARAGFDPARLILGGDHLGPSPWRDLPAEDALDRAERMVDAYVRAGFGKIHLDASMGCAGEPAAISDEVTAKRAARLARISEAAAREEGLPAPHYVIGTEVPVPGGATEALDHLQPTSPEAVQRTVDIHRAAFAATGVEAAFDHAIGLVVQPGVEFSSESVHVYDRAATTELVKAGRALPSLVFEAHSTDYQPESALAALVQDGFAILKVGPALTFSLREALYGLDAIRAFMLSTPKARILGISCTKDLARKHSNDTRKVMESDWYREAFLKTKLAKDTADYFETTVGGFRRAASPEVGVTGKGATHSIVDDLVDANDAGKVALQIARFEWLMKSVFSRFDNPNKGVFLYIGQRLHIEDPAAPLIKMPGNSMQVRPM